MAYRRLLAGSLAIALLGIAAPAAAYDPNQVPGTGGGVDGGSFFVGIIAPGRRGEPGGNGQRRRRAAAYTVHVGPGRARWSGQAPACDAGGAPGWLHALVVRDLVGRDRRQRDPLRPAEPRRHHRRAARAPAGPLGGRDLARRAPPDRRRPASASTRRRSGSPASTRGSGTTVRASCRWPTSIGPWTVTGTAGLAEVTFDLGDGETVTASGPGSEAEPAATHVYETKGTYTITVTARWTADFVLAGPGLPGRPTPMGAAVLRSTRDYPVQEVRGLLVPDR